MRVIKSLRVMQQLALKLRLEGKSIGFVPTMGYLHEGHLSLVRMAKKNNDVCVVSIYVNPTQFSPQEDLAKYPRDLRRDSSLLKKENVDICFIPSDNDMYPKRYLTYIDVLDISNVLCGRFRPGHFRGVATIVVKLINLVMPQQLYLGAKDAQQVIVLKKVIADLNVPVKVKVVPTKREPDGLAMSSRNVYLKPRQRQEAIVIYRALSWAKELVASGETDARRLIQGVKELILSQSQGNIQYVECVDATTLQAIGKISGPVLIAVAVYFGTTRLIDNVFITPKCKK